MVLHLIQSYGYWILFLLVGIESLGIPLPGETALITAAAFAAQGRLSIAYVAAVGILAAIAGDNSAYWLGRKGGLTLVQRYGHRVGLTTKKLDRARGLFERHGWKTVLFGRFVAILRSWAAMLAGVMHMSYPRFVTFNAAGCIAWASVFSALGYVFGRNLPLLERYAREVGIAIAILVVIGIAVAVYRHRSKR